MVRDVVIPLSIHSVWYEEKRFELVNIASRKNDVIVLANGSWTFSLPLFVTYKQILQCTYRDFMSYTFQYIPIRRSVTLAYVRRLKHEFIGSVTFENFVRVKKKKKHIRSFSSVIIYIYFFLLWRCDPTQVMASSFLRFLDHTQRHNTVGMTPLDEWSARRRELYLKTHITNDM